MTRRENVSHIYKWRVTLWFLGGENISPRLHAADVIARKMRSLHFAHSSFSSHIKKLRAAFCGFEHKVHFRAQKPQVVFDGV